MPHTKINKAQRKAAGMSCLTLFAVANTVSQGLKQVAATHPPSGGGTGAGLTDKERQYVLNLASDFHDKGEIIRKLGWRFLK